jgi:hypothetical protein
MKLVSHLVLLSACCLLFTSLAEARTGWIVLQFDDGHVSHYTDVYPILTEHLLPGSFGVVTGQLSSKPTSMTYSQVLELNDHGHEIHDHTWNHEPWFWGDPSNCDRWPERILVSQAVFDSLGLRIAGWNQPGGTGQGFTVQLQETLATHGYTYAAGRVGLVHSQGWNFHWGAMDSPFSLGRGGVVSWGFNADVARLECGYLASERPIDPCERTPQVEVPSAAEELRALITRTADAVAQGVFAVPVFHRVGAADSTKWALDSLCTWIVDQGLTVRRMREAVWWAYNYPQPYGENIAAPLRVDRNEDGRPDGWKYVNLNGLAQNGAETTIYGPRPGILIVKAGLTSTLDGTFSILYQSTRIDPDSFDPDTLVYVTENQYRSHTVRSGKVNRYADTLAIEPDVDRVRIQLSRFPGIVHLMSFEATSVPTATGAKSSPARKTLLHVWPNPSRGWFSIETDAAEVEIFDVQGRRVRRLTASSHPFTRLIGDLPSGVYFIRASRDNRAETRRKITVVR